ncbi:MAG TPA: SCO family protein [Thermoleophilaceae bacterium]|nr:SCO family protein [Thermoleophilaceae bacterium]
MRIGRQSEPRSPGGSYRLRLIALVALAVAVLGALTAVAHLRVVGGGGATVQSGFLGSHPPLGTALDRPVPNLALIDDRGHRTSLAAYRGRYLVLAPSLTLCHEVCPMTTAALDNLQSTFRRDGLGSDVAVAEVTVDPWRDTPARLRAYRRLAGVNFDLLTGTPAEIRRVWKFFGVYYRRVPQGKPPDMDWLTHRPETFDVQHTDGVFILDPSGHWRIGDLGMPYVGRKLPSSLRKLLNDQGVHNLRHPSTPWTPREALDDVFYLKQREDAASGTPAPAHAPSQAAARKELAGSPPALAALHSRAGALLGGGTAAFNSALKSLSGRPVVINEWASWCFPCRSEFPLLQTASAHFGKNVGFLGVNVDDRNGSARAFLNSHPLSYPSYQDPNGQIAQTLAPTQGLPITIYLNRRGGRVYVHSGYYSSQAALDADIERYALGG